MTRNQRVAAACALFLFKRKMAVMVIHRKAPAGLADHCETNATTYTELVGVRPDERPAIALACNESYRWFGMDRGWQAAALL